MTNSIQHMTFTARILPKLVKLGIIFVIFWFVGNLVAAPNAEAFVTAYIPKSHISTAGISNIGFELIGVDLSTADPTAQAAVERFCEIFVNAMYDLAIYLLDVLREMVIFGLNYASEILKARFM